jgi:hypothetical protein
MRLIFGVLLAFSLAVALGIAQLVGSDVDARRARCAARPSASPPAT